MSERYRPRAFDVAQSRPHSLSIPLYLVFTVLTVGVFNLYWNYRQMQSCNELLDRGEFSFGMWILLCIVTCGLYHFYYQYKMGAAINEIQHAYELPVTADLPVLSLLTTLIGFGIVTDCIHQHEINKIDAELE